jgi:hypothetical protein
MNIPKFTEADFHAVEIARCKNDVRYFIEDYVYIEDRDNLQDIAIRFNLWGGQAKTLLAFLSHRLI